LTPNSAALFNSMAQSPGGTRYGNVDMNMTDPSSSTGTGLTPNYQMDSANPFALMNNVASPFSVFNNAGTGTGMMDVPANLDWVGLFFTELDRVTDKYIGGMGFVRPEQQRHRASIPVLPNVHRSVRVESRWAVE
jgi:hypothetical protein